MAVQIGAPMSSAKLPSADESPSCVTGSDDESEPTEIQSVSITTSPLLPPGVKPLPLLPPLLLLLLLLPLLLLLLLEALAVVPDEVLPLELVSNGSSRSRERRERCQSELCCKRGGGRVWRVEDGGRRETRRKEDDEVRSVGCAPTLWSKSCTTTEYRARSRAAPELRAGSENDAVSVSALPLAPVRSSMCRTWGWGWGAGRRRARRRYSVKGLTKGRTLL